MKKCPTCDSSFSDDQFFCSSCGTRLVDVQPEQSAASKPTKKSKLLFFMILGLWIVTVCAIIYVLNEKTYYYDRYNYYVDEYYDAKEELSQAKSELEDLAEELSQAKSELEDLAEELSQAESGLEKLEDLAGVYGYGSKNFYSYKSVLVLQKFESKEITLYADLDGRISFHNSNSGISCKWGEWSSSKAQITITGNSAGFYVVGFTNSENSDSFEILVIVIEP